MTCEFGISVASRLTCRCVRILECANHLRVHCTCTMHPSPFLHTAPSRPCQGAPMYRVWCRWLKVHFHRRTPRQNSFFAPGACSWHPTGTAPQWILSWCSTRVTCEFQICGAPRVTCRGVRKFLVDLHAAARATCHVPPADPRPAPWSFRRFGASIGATPVPIGPAVQALCPEMLEHTHRQTDRLTNTSRPTFFSDPPEEIFVHKNVLC